METSPATIHNNTQKTKLNLKRSVGICSFFCLFSLFLHSLLGVIVSAAGLNKNLMLYIFSSAVITVCATLLPALFLIKTGGSIKKCIRLKSTKTGVFDSVLLVVFGVTGCIVANFFIELTASFMPRRSVSNVIVYDGSFMTIVFMALSFALIPAICEEIAYRGYIYRSAQRYGQLFAVIFSSLMFSLMHSDIPTAAFAFICGFIIGCVRKTTGSILLGIIIHFLNNLMSVIGTAIKVYGGKDDYGTAFYFITNISLILFLISAYIIYRRKLKLFSFGKSPCPLGKRDKLILTISCPVFIGFVLTAVIEKFL